VRNHIFSTGQSVDGRRALLDAFFDDSGDPKQGCRADLALSSGDFKIPVELASSFTPLCRSSSEGGPWFYRSEFARAVDGLVLTDAGIVISIRHHHNKGARYCHAIARTESHGSGTNGYDSGGKRP
jgi:hypothetical protein